MGRTSYLRAGAGAIVSGDTMAPPVNHVSGHALADGGLTLDLGPMDGVRVEPEARRARVGPG